MKYVLLLCLITSPAFADDGYSSGYNAGYYIGAMPSGYSDYSRGVRAGADDADEEEQAVQHKDDGIEVSGDEPDADGQ